MDTPAEVLTMFKMVCVVFFQLAFNVGFDGVLDEKKDNPASDGQRKDKHRGIADEQLVTDAEIRKPA